MSLETRATRDVIAERLRQISSEGWTAEHDDEHRAGEMAAAAAAYAYLSTLGDEDRAIAAHLDHSAFRINVIRWLWPEQWGWRWWKPKSRRQDLVRAAALLIAEIERLDRAEAKARLAAHG